MLRSWLTLRPGVVFQRRRRAEWSLTYPRGVDLPEAERRFREARVARLATVRPNGAPHVVPVVFALQHETVWLVVDEKPKRTRELSGSPTSVLSLA